MRAAGGTDAVMRAARWWVPWRYECACFAAGAVSCSKKVLLRSSPAEKAIPNQATTSPAPRRFDLSGTTIHFVAYDRWLLGERHDAVVALLEEHKSSKSRGAAES